MAAARMSCFGQCHDCSSFCLASSNNNSSRNYNKRLRDQTSTEKPARSSTPEFYTQLRTEVLRRDGWRCQSCGSRTSLQAHHIEKLSQGGEDADENLITLCTKCHWR